MLLTVGLAHMNGIHKPGKMKYPGILSFQGDGWILHAEYRPDTAVAPTLYPKVDTYSTVHHTVGPI